MLVSAVDATLVEMSGVVPSMIRLFVGMYQSKGRMPRVTFADSMVFYDCARDDDPPSPGDTLTVLWDTTDEVHIFGVKVRGWMPCIVYDAPEDGETSVYRLFYPSNTLRAIYGSHPGMVVHQNLSKLEWRWHEAVDEWEYRAQCEMKHVT